MASPRAKKRGSGLLQGKKWRGGEVPTKKRVRNALGGGIKISSVGTANQLD
jgi:hypothetical protein